LLNKPEEKSQGKDSLKLERLTAADIPDVVCLSEMLGWDYGEQEIRLVLEAGQLFGHRNSEGTVVSTSAIFPYAGELASLGLVMVDPAYRRRGLATVLVQRCLAAAVSCPVMLVATSQGMPLYEKLGFKTVDTLHKLVAEKYPGLCGPVRNDAGLSPLTELDIPDIMRLDRQAFGADRGKFILLRIRQAAHTAVLRDRSGRLTGYALGVQTPERLVIGPVIATNWRDAAILVDAIARNHEGTMRIDIPSGHQELISWMLRCGFRLANIPPVMMLGSGPLPPRHNLFAVAAQAYG
jgi:GNAT superfamily N-acetyltransferase